jgi:hypothetical protein
MSRSGGVITRIKPGPAPDIAFFNSAIFSVVNDPVGMYTVYTNPVTFAPNNSITINGLILNNSTTGNYVVRYNIRHLSDANAVNIAVSQTVSLVNNTPLLVTQTALVPTGTPDAVYRIDVMVSTTGGTPVLNVRRTCIFYVQTAAITTLPYKVGVYRSAQDPTAIYCYENWLGRRMDWILDTIPSDNTGSITTAFADYVTNGWGYFASQWATDKSRVVVTMPMLPVQGNYGAPSLGSSGASTALANGASGSYDSYWTTLGTNMVASGFTNNLIRLGWEMNGNWYNWSAVFNSTAWVTYFQRIVTTLRAVTGFNCKFVFNPTIGYVMMGADSVYPGDTYIDYIGLDVYDTDYNGYYPINPTDTPAQILTKQSGMWSFDIISDPHGIPFWVSFASTHSKPFGIFEWGCSPGGDGVSHGGGDNTYFIQHMHDYAEANSIATMLYFDLTNLEALFNSPQLPTAFPNASALYQSLFGPTGS